MKNFNKVFLVMFITVMTISCGSDDDGTIALTSDSILGVYQLDYYRTMDTETVSNNGDTSTSVYTSEGSQFNVLWDFKANGTFTTVGEMTVTYTDLYQGQTDTYSQPVDFTNEGTYLVSDDGQKLSITFSTDFGDETTVFDVIAFTATDLDLRSEEDFSDGTYTEEYISEIGLKR